MSKRKNPTTQQVKADLARLKKMGLYTGNLRRKEPTRYAKKLAKEFGDVLNGRAQIVTVPKHPTKKAKGIAAARAQAKALAEEFGGTMRAKGTHVIVKTASPQEKAVFLPSRKTIVTRYKEKSGRTITHEYIRSGEGRLPPLGDDERYALPFNRGRNGVYYIERATEEEILALANEYENKGHNPYRGAAGHIQIAYPGTRRRSPKRAASVTGSNIIDLNSRRR